MKIIRILYILFLVPLFCQAQNNEIPDSFKYLQKLEIDKEWNIYVYTKNDVDTNVKEISIKIGVFEYEYLEPICFVSIDGKEDSKILVGFSRGMSDDPSFEFFKKINNKYKHLFSLGGQQLFIPGNGNLYISGEANHMFNRKAKYKYENDTVKEVKQAFLYVGMKTVTKKTINLYSDKDCTSILATLPEKSKIEIVASETSDDINYYFLIKSSFGLLGWWKLDDYYSQSIEDLYFHGD